MNINTEIIKYIDSKKSDLSILNLIKMNMYSNKLILNDIDNKYIETIIDICKKYSIEYEVVGFNKKILMLYNTSHTYLDNFVQCSKKCTYNTSEFELDEMNDSDNISEEEESNNISEEEESNNISEEEESDNISEEEESYSNYSDSDYKESEIDSEIESELTSKNDLSSVSYCNEKNNNSKEINIFTNGEKIIYIISSINLLFNIIILYYIK